MKSTGLRSALGIIKDFCRDNRKSVISFCALFALGIVIGIFITIDSAGGEFERISRADMEFGSVKVFFTTSFMVLAGYGVLLLGAGAPAFAVAGLVVFAVHGYYFGKYVCLLVAMYGATGVVNMIVVYIPFFLVTLVCMIVAGVRALNTVGCNRFRTAGLALLKIYGLNIAVNFVVFVIKTRCSCSCSRCLQQARYARQYSHRERALRVRKSFRRKGNPPILRTPPRARCCMRKTKTKDCPSRVWSRL